MPLKNTKKETSAKIAKTFARFFENSNYSRRVQWLQRNEDDDPIETEKNISRSIAVHDETAENARSPLETTEKVKKFNCRKRSRTTVVENPHLLRFTRSTYKLLSAAKTIEEATDAKTVRVLKENKDLPASVDAKTVLVLKENKDLLDSVDAKTVRVLKENKDLPASVDETEEWPPDVNKPDFVQSDNGSLGLQEQDDATSQKCSHLIADANKTNLTNDDSCVGIDDIDAASTVSGQLRRFITFYDRQGSKLSIDEEKELEDLIGKPANGNDLQAADELDASNNCQQMSTEPINNQCTYDRSFDVLPDAHNPMVLHVCPKIPGDRYNRRMIRLRNQSSVFYDGPELKRCAVTIKDFRLENIEFSAAKPQNVKRLRKPKNNYFRQPRRQSTVNRTKRRASKRKIGAQIEIEKLAQRSSLWSAIQEAYLKEDVPEATHKIADATHEIPEATHDIPKNAQEIADAIQEIPPFAPVNPTEKQAISIEEKNVSINEWLELSSLIQPDNNVHVNEFLQYASPILSDIEDEAYKLSTFLDFTSNVRTAQQIYDKEPANTVANTTDEVCEPPDLSMKRITPASTDTGFCDVSFSLDITSPYSSTPKQTPASHVDTDVRDVYNNFCTDNYRSGGTAVDHTPSASQIVDSAIPLSMTTQTTDKQHCVAEPMVEVTPVALPVIIPPETKAPQEVMVSQRIVTTNWNFDNYSTDLDYEPSDEDDEDDKLSNTSSHQTTPFASQTVDSAIPLSMTTTQTTDKQHCVAEPMVEVTPDVPVTLPVIIPPETKASQEVMVPQRTVTSTNWNFDNYSTDLDYEPSEDEDDEDDKLSNTSSHQTESITPSVDTDIARPIDVISLTDTDIGSPIDPDIIPPGDKRIVPLVGTDIISAVDITPIVDITRSVYISSAVDVTPAVDITRSVYISSAVDVTPAVDITTSVPTETTPPVDITPSIDTNITQPVYTEITPPIDTQIAPPVDTETTQPVDTETTPPVTIDLTLEPCIEGHNNSGIKARNKRDTRVVSRSLSSKSIESKRFTSAPVNVVESQPTTTEELRPAILLRRVPSLPTDTQANTAVMPLIGVRPPPDHLKQPATTDQIELLKQQVQYLLNRICFSYLADEACTKNTCRKNHKLPTADEVLKKLKFFPTETVLTLYSSFIVRVRMAFINYFPTVCEIFSIRKLKSELIVAVEHCDQHNKKSFYSHIYRACIRLGMPKVEALSEIAKGSCKSTISCTYILNIIVREDPELFQQMLQDFYPLANIDSRHILSLLSRLSENPQPKLLNILVDMFNKYSWADINDIGLYKMIYHEIQSLASNNPPLVLRLKSIATRDKRLDSE
ncbi:uncharacterized protein LOC119082028 isoform X1 [Bradysia coprophila]|uniref:uncharacterized protein LOC119082028 isoform X1 n=1 Tax=Bradysia coprophila TaxID=38358 RepID=UPI00187DC5C0|nr:uncharacterized protein LOC119082028 isoform X1 [Bradysia coprophila]XP_037047244.1 uncharacterized protein LOC119082028 isoform X1 [Bradysia coprophila]